MKISLLVMHMINHHKTGERWARRPFPLEEMIKVLVELDIEYHGLLLDVNIRNISSLVLTRLPLNWTTSVN
ncbi:hypothetical protein NC652_005190 [Populus alba x Populus x berolinensis]|nr:hypothetical protein NC652_005190 [Populus alba x Populus x berolinensis]